MYHRQAKVAISEFRTFIATHPKFPRGGPYCHIYSCKALEYFRKHNVDAKLVYFNPERLKEVTFSYLAPNHVWVDMIGIGYYDAIFDNLWTYENHPYGDSKLFSSPDFDKLEDIVGKDIADKWNGAGTC